VIGLLEGALLPGSSRVGLSARMITAQQPPCDDTSAIAGSTQILREQGRCGNVAFRRALRRIERTSLPRMDAAPQKSPSLFVEVLAYMSGEPTNRPNVICGGKS
jgi:hypothetical protein